MNALFGSPALALLLRLKLRGLVRRQWRRLRTPKGLFLSLLGGVAFLLWIGGLTVYTNPSKPYSAPDGELRVRGFALLFVLLSLSSALTNRGLYLPKSEIERLFAAPLSRAALVRYRLVAGGLRSLLGGVVLGLFGARRMPEPALAFAGILLAMQTLPVLNQLAAIALGGLEERAALALRRIGSLLLFTMLALLGAVVFALATDRPLASLPIIGPRLAHLVDVEGELLANPMLARPTIVFVPWARMIAAESAGAFWPWLAVCFGLHVILVELCARLPIDFRELSLATSARAARWRIPWLFGRGPAGAIAWRKSAGLARKAKGALWVAVVALLFITIFVSLMLDGSGGDESLAPVMIAILGTFYLCSGLRFDFREELERMDVIRAWPLAPARVFLAMLLPEVVLVALLLGATVLAESALAGRLSLEVLGVVACLPCLVFAWVAADNLVFLFAPVRTVPGQDGFVQNAGRRMLQMGMLALVFALLIGLATLAFVACALFVGELLGGSEALAQACGFAGGLAVLAAGDALLVLLGGAVLRRFDVARDRG